MMLRLEPLRQFAHGGPVALRISLDMQKQQILQRRDAFALCGLFGEPLEAPHLIAELRELLKIGFAQPASPFFHCSFAALKKRKLYHEMM